MRQVVVELGEYRNRYCNDRGETLVVYTIHIRFHRLVVMLETCATGFGTLEHWGDAAWYDAVLLVWII